MHSTVYITIKPGNYRLVFFELNTTVCLQLAAVTLTLES